MKPTSIEEFHAAQSPEDLAICERLRRVIDEGLPEATAKIWHAHPVWFLDDNPTVGYSKLQRVPEKLEHFSDKDSRQNNDLSVSSDSNITQNALKGCIRLMFWSGADFEEPDLKPGTGKFKDASVRYRDASEINEDDLKRWLQKSREIQWDYKTIYKRKGRLERLV